MVVVYGLDIAFPSLITRAPTKQRKNSPMAFPMDAHVISCPIHDVKMRYSTSTTASLKTLSPNTR